jgi:hypothetical protein
MSKKNMSFHFQARFNERVQCDTIDSFITAVNTGSIFITHHHYSKLYGTVSTHCIYENMLGELFIAIHRGTKWITILPIEYHIDNIKKIGNELITKTFFKKLNQYNLTHELY